VPAPVLSQHEGPAALVAEAAPRSIFDQLPGNYQIH